MEDKGCNPYKNISQKIIIIIVIIIIIDDDDEPEFFDKFISRLRLQTAQYEFWRRKHKDEVNSEFDKRFIEQIIAGAIYLDVQKELLAGD